MHVKNKKHILSLGMTNRKNLPGSTKAVHGLYSDVKYRWATVHGTVVYMLASQSQSVMLKTSSLVFKVSSSVVSILSSVCRIFESAATSILQNEWISHLTFQSSINGQNCSSMKQNFRINYGN